jgi:hypothetical protein
VKIVTGHDLRTGEVVYMTADGGWVKHIADGAAFEEDASIEALARGKSQPTLITNVYLVEADAPGEPAKRVKIREDIRARGPTVRLDLGKQAERA